jgi:hypothetical protein
MERRLRQSKAPSPRSIALGRFRVFRISDEPARLVKPERTMGRIGIQPAGQAFKQRVEEWMQSLTDHDFEILAARRDQLIGQLEALYRSVRLEVGMQT